MEWRWAVGLPLFVLGVYQAQHAVLMDHATCPES